MFWSFRMASFFFPNDGHNCAHRHAPTRSFVDETFDFTSWKVRSHTEKCARSMTKTKKAFTRTPHQITTQSKKHCRQTNKLESRKVQSLPNTSPQHNRISPQQTSTHPDTPHPGPSSSLQHCSIASEETQTQKLNSSLRSPASIAAALKNVSSKRQELHYLLCV
jgi:hypothetical protein